jgi:hypothetical protein
MRRRQRWRDLLIVLVLAAMSFAGSFECHVHSGDDDHHVHAAKASKAARRAH